MKQQPYENQFVNVQREEEFTAENAETAEEKMLEAR
jgi:hypothetical protein